MLAAPSNGAAAEGRKRIMAEPDTPLVLDVQALAALCGVSSTTIRRWNAERLLPAPATLRRRRYWPRALIERWIALGMPDRRRWETMLRAEQQRPRRFAKRGP